LVWGDLVKSPLQAPAAHEISRPAQQVRPAAYCRFDWTPITKLLFLIIHTTVNKSSTRVGLNEKTAHWNDFPSCCSPPIAKARRGGDFARATAALFLQDWRFNR
jgi:hypothetical protein